MEASEHVAHDVRVNGLALDVLNLPRLQSCSQCLFLVASALDPPTEAGSALLLGVPEELAGVSPLVPLIKGVE